MTIAARLLRLEHVQDVAERAQARAHRARMAQFFLDEGDPRENSTFGELTPADRVRWAWLFDAWQTTPAGFVAGELPDSLSPEPSPFVLYIPPGIT